MKEINLSYDKILRYSQNKTQKRFKTPVVPLNGQMPERRMNKNDKQTLTDPDMIEMLDKMREYLLDFKNRVRFFFK